MKESKTNEPCDYRNYPRWATFLRLTLSRRQRGGHGNRPERSHLVRVMTKPRSDKGGGDHRGQDSSGAFCSPRFPLSSASSPCRAFRGRTNFALSSLASSGFHRGVITSATAARTSSAKRVIVGAVTFSRIPWIFSTVARPPPTTFAETRPNFPRPVLSQNSRSRQVFAIR